MSLRGDRETESQIRTAGELAARDGLAREACPYLVHTRGGLWWLRGFDSRTGQRYARDGLCHNAEPGTFGHECGRPAVVVGVFKTGFRSGFCAGCRERGAEARAVVAWEALS